MKKIVSVASIVVISAFLLTGCGSYSDYATQANNANIQMLELWKNAEQQRVQTNKENLQAFSLAMNNAAKTPDSGDDVAIAMSYAYNSQQKSITLPKLQRVERPNDFVDGIKATVPFMNSIAPWLGMAYMTDKISDNAGSRYDVSGSGNTVGSTSGSFNPVNGYGEGSTSSTPVLSANTDDSTTSSESPVIPSGY